MGNKAAKAKNPDHVSFGKLFAWQTRPIALGAATIIVGYLSSFCTDTLGMPIGLIGMLIMGSKIFDGFTDLIAGWIVDNTNTKLGKGRPYEFCIIGVWVCMYALFATPEKWSTTGKAVWIFIMYTLVWSIFSTMLNAAENPYIIRAFRTPVAITKVSAFGGVIVTIGCMVVSITFPMAISSMATSAAGWQKILLMYSVPLAALGMLRFLFVKEDTESISQEEEKKEEEPVSIKDIFVMLRKNPYVWLLGIACAVPQIITGMSVAQYYYPWIAGGMSKYATIQGFSMVSLLVMFIFPTLMKKHSGMKLVGVFAAISIIGYVVNFFAGASVPMLVLGFLISGLSALPTSYMRAPISLQIAEYNVKKGLPEMVSTIGSVSNFLVKLGQALGVGIGSLMLGAAGYVSKASVQPDSALLMIRLLYSLIPAALMLIMIWTSIAFRPLDKLTMRAEADQK